jgi:type VI secretion system protein ImpK
VATTLATATPSAPPPVVPPPSEVSEICAPALLLAVQLRDAREIDDMDATRRRIREMLDRTELELRAAGLDEPDTSDTMFALVAALDEAITRSGWDQKELWIARPMQFERFGRYDAGEEFFVRLDRLRQERVPRMDVLHVYYLCLALGFKGQYQVRPDAEWEELVGVVAARLRRGEPDARLPLAPHGMPGEEIGEVVREIPVWVIVAAAGAFASLIYLVLMALVSRHAGTVERVLAAP